MASGLAVLYGTCGPLKGYIEVPICFQVGGSLVRDARAIGQSSDGHVSPPLRWLWTTRSSFKSSVEVDDICMSHIESYVCVILLPPILNSEFTDFVDLTFGTG